jgi:hypothetical protein
MSSERILLICGAVQAVGVILVFFRLDVRVFSRLGKYQVGLTEKQIQRRRIRMLKTTRREKFMLILGVGCLFCAALGLYRTMSFSIPAGIHYLDSWGLNFPFPNATANKMELSGSVLMPYRINYRVAGACFRYHGTADILDATGLQKSGLYDIKDEALKIEMPWDSSFIDTIKRGEVETSCSLLLVPNGVTMDQFSTLRQAEAIGVKVLQTVAGPP